MAGDRLGLRGDIRAFVDLVSERSELPLVKVNVAVPTGIHPTRFGLKGTALNAGPVVRNRVPEYAFAPVCVAVTEPYTDGRRPAECRGMEFASPSELVEALAL